MANFVADAISGILSPVSDYLTNRATIKEAGKKRKDELKKLSLEAQIKGVEQNIDIDAKNGTDPIPWANDLTLLIFLMPFVLAFYPPALPHIEAGFEALKAMPEWYKWSLGMMLVSVWGYRNLVTPIVKVVTTAYLKRYSIKG